LRRLTRVAAREDPGVRRAKAGVHLESEGDAPGIRAVALSLYLLASCTIVMLADGGPRGAIYDLRWILFLSDACLGLVVVAHLTDLPALWRDPRRHRAALAAAVLGVSLLPAWIAHPSAQGNAAVLRW